MQSYTTGYLTHVSELTIPYTTRADQEWRGREHKLGISQRIRIATKSIIASMINHHQHSYHHAVVFSWGIGMPHQFVVHGFAHLRPLLVPKHTTLMTTLTTLLDAHVETERWAGTAWRSAWMARFKKWVT